jgi:hypothetical protein
VAKTWKVREVGACVAGREVEEVSVWLVGFLVQYLKAKGYARLLPLIRTSQLYLTSALVLQALLNHPSTRSCIALVLGTLYCTRAQARTRAFASSRDAKWYVFAHSVAHLPIRYDADGGCKASQGDLQTDPPCHSRACAIQSNSTSP